MDFNCDNCERDIKNPSTDYVVYINHHYSTGNISTEHMICSPSCLVEWAWKVKEGQTKLSKSKVENDTKVDHQ
jgi:hypothetical protein